MKKPSKIIKLAKPIKPEPQGNQRSTSKFVTLRLPNELDALTRLVADQAGETRSKLLIRIIENWAKRRK